jgi:hypothetical protein
MTVEEDNYEPYCYNIYGFNYDPFYVIPCLCFNIYGIDEEQISEEEKLSVGIEDGENNDQNMINNASTVNNGKGSKFSLFTRYG